VKEKKEYNEPQKYGLRLAGMFNRRLCELGALLTCTYILIHDRHNFNSNSKSEFIDKVSSSANWQVPADGFDEYNDVTNYIQKYNNYLSILMV